MYLKVSVLAKWGEFKHGDQSFDLSHLDDQVVSIRVGDADIGILVRFSDHCFTENALENDTRPVFESSTRDDGRFCSKRYAASLKIWDCLNHAMGGRVWCGEFDRYLVVSIDLGKDQDPRYYVIPFTLERFKGVEGVQLQMRVRSAFLRTPNRHIATFGEVRFPNLVMLTLKGKSPQRIFGQKRKMPW
jgi:hypothetical protein